MTDLLRLQRAFARSLLDPVDQRRPACGLVGDASLIERRLSIYRATIAAAALKALAAAYPVVQQLVGEEFFGGLAREYLRAFPSTSGDLYDFGDTFPRFLHDFPHTKSLAYLPDLARLEWHAHQAYGAHDAERFDIGALAQVPAEQQGEICFRWAAGTALIISSYPIVQLWQIHQPNFNGEFAVDWSTGECACVARDGFDVTVSSIAKAEAAFVSASLAGASLGSACEAAISIDQEFEPGALLARAIGSNLITGYILPSAERNS